SSAMQIPILRCEFPVCDADRLVPLKSSSSSFSNFLAGNAPIPSLLAFANRQNFLFLARTFSESVTSKPGRQNGAHPSPGNEFNFVCRRSSGVLSSRQERNRLLHTGPYGASSRLSRLMTAHWHVGIHTCPHRGK